MTKYGRTKNRSREILDQPETGWGDCQWTGCKERGKYRAPVNRYLQKFYWLCLEHVRTYNSQWNYLEGMSESEIELEIRNSTTWNRPTWKMESLGNQSFGWQGANDMFGVLGTSANRKNTDKEKNNTVKVRRLEADHKKALAILNLDETLSLKILKSRYKFLVKKYHPDANGGCTKAEQRMKLINFAYTKLREIVAQ